MSQGTLNPFTHVKVFSATKHQERDVLGEKVTNFLVEHPNLEVVSTEVRQSSDSDFHCLSITLFMRVKDE